MPGEDGNRSFFSFEFALFLKRHKNLDLRLKIKLEGVSIEFVS